MRRGCKDERGGSGSCEITEGWNRVISGESKRWNYFEHLDECYAEIEVTLVTAYQAGAEQDADRDDGSKVGPTCHSDCFAAIE